MMTKSTQAESTHFQETLAAARGGDSSAMDELFKQFYPRVQRMVHQSLARDLRSNRPWLTSRFSTGDVVQEVFRSLLKDLGAFEGKTEDAFSGYLAMVVRNRLLDAIRFHEAAQRDGRRTSSSIEDSDPVSPNDGPATDAASADEVDGFQELVSTFPEREQLLLRARIEQGVKFQDLADQLGYSSKSAARRAFYSAQARLVIRLRQRLSQDLPGHP
jgi:RNA polymerase sigma factor (sigma-70 family)